MDCVKAPTSIPNTLYHHSPELSLTIIHCVFAANTNKPNAFSILRNMALCTPTDHPAECKMSADFSGCC